MRINYLKPPDFRRLVLLADRGKEIERGKFIFQAEHLERIRQRTPQDIYQEGMGLFRTGLWEMCAEAAKYFTVLLERYPENTYFKSLFIVCEDRVMRGENDPIDGNKSELTPQQLKIREAEEIIAEAKEADVLPWQPFPRGEQEDQSFPPSAEEVEKPTERKPSVRKKPKRIKEASEAFKNARAVDTRDVAAYSDIITEIVKRRSGKPLELAGAAKMVPAASVEEEKIGSERELRKELAQIFEYYPVIQAEQSILVLKNWLKTKSLEEVICVFRIIEEGTLGRSIIDKTRFNLLYARLPLLFPFEDPSRILDLIRLMLSSEQDRLLFSILRSNLLESKKILQILSNKQNLAKVVFNRIAALGGEAREWVKGITQKPKVTSPPAKEIKRKGPKKILAKIAPQSWYVQLEGPLTPSSVQAFLEGVNHKFAYWEALMGLIIKNPRSESSKEDAQLLKDEILYVKTKLQEIVEAKLKTEAELNDLWEKLTLIEKTLKEAGS